MAAIALMFPVGDDATYHNVSLKRNAYFFVTIEQQTLLQDVNSSVYSTISAYRMQALDIYLTMITSTDSLRYDLALIRRWVGARRPQRLVMSQIALDTRWISCTSK